MSLRDLPSLLRRRASSTVRDGWKVIRPRRQSVSTTDLGPQVNRLRQTAHQSKSAGKLRREDEAESFLPGTIGGASPTRLERTNACAAIKVPEIPSPGAEMSSVPTPSTGSSGVLQGALAPETPPANRSAAATISGFDHVTYFSDLRRPGSRPRPRPCFLHLEEVSK
eukprot:Skav206572  [mRNA]  locus=scaffold925:459206:473357:- [translate_table: standard]